MKKILSIILAAAMIFSTFAFSVSAATNEKVKYPIIFIAGSSVDLVDADQNPVSTGFDVFTDDDEGDLTKEDIIQKIVNILKPLFFEGLASDNWENYRIALYEELAPLFDEGQLDNNGNSKYGIGVAQAELTQMVKNSEKNHGADGTFNVFDYKFRYDWRLSPYDTVDALHAHIQKIIAATNCDKVCLVGRCLGGNLITAYLDKYGYENQIAKVVYDETMANGSATINDCFSGKIKLNDKYAQAYVLQSEYYGKDDIGIEISGMSEVLLEAINRTLDMTTQTGILTTVFGSLELLYAKLYEAFMPSILLATGIATWPSYWTSVYEKDMDAALTLMFGAPNSERRAEYAGLVEKILYIRNHITIPRERRGDENLYKQFEKNYGVEFGIIAGYGLVQAPITESYALTGDCTVDLRSASFGATAAGVFDTLSDEYIAQRQALNLGDHISPDKKVDTSTCLFPDTTWIIKNKHHDVGAGWGYIAERFCQYKDFTVTNNYKDISRFTVVVKSNDSSANGIANMTTENCGDAEWITAVEQKPTTQTKIFSLVTWLMTIIEIVIGWLSGMFNTAA